MMKNRTITAMLVLSVFGLAACDDEDPVDVGTDTDEIVGTWVSQGDDVAPGLVSLGSVDSIFATFNEDQTYEVTTYAGGSDQPQDVSGTYVTDPEGDGGEVRAISLDQSAPALTAQGIFQVDGNSMQYEVIQTTPDIGAIPPTAEAGFGSTVVGGQTTGETWIQNYVRVSND